MPFYPENRFPKQGLPVYNGEGDQRNLSDPRFQYQDGLENTQKYPDSSTDNLYGTTGAAWARSLQIGCEGFHEITLHNETFYRPCFDPSTYELRLEQLESALNFSYIGNYRVLSWDSPFQYVESFDGWILDTGTISNSGPIVDAQDILVDFRYSTDGKNWSLWENIGSARSGPSRGWQSGNRAELFKIPLNPSLPFYPEIRFTSVLINDDGTIIYNTDEIIDPNVVILNFDLDLQYQEFPFGPDGPVLRKPAPACSTEKSNRPIIFDSKPFTFRPYQVNSAINLYQDLSKIVNKVFGFDVNYYSVQPQARGKDVVLKEYTIFDVVEEKCVKVMVPNNQFPDNKINFDPFGLQFDEPFEIHIDKGVFESYFGKGSQPRRRDIIYFPLTNRIYEINSTYLFRDFMNQPVYFKIELKKYEPKSNTYFQDPAFKEELDGISLNSQTLFGEEIKNEEEKITKPQQYFKASTAFDSDPVRSYLYDSLPVVDYELNNNWTIVTNSYYDLSAAFVPDSEFSFEPNPYRTGVVYKSLPSIDESGEFCFTSWMNIRNYLDTAAFAPKAPIPLVVTIESITDSLITFSTFPKFHRLQPWISYESTPDGYVSISGDPNFTGGFRVNSVIDDHTFTILRPSPQPPNTSSVWRMQKAQSRNLISGLYSGYDSLNQPFTKGMRIDLVYSGSATPAQNNYINSGSIVVRLNDLEVNSSLQFSPEQGDWYGLVVNFSNTYKQLGVNIWSINSDPSIPIDQGSDLRKVHEDIRTLQQAYTYAAPSSIIQDPNNPLYGTEENAYKIFTGPIHLTNIRLMDKMLDIDRQSNFLNQNIVRDAQNSILIDNAKPQLNLRKFARNR
jgi:hypothetical protein